MTGPSTDEVVAELRLAGLDAYAEHAVPEIMIHNPDDGPDTYLTRAHNREDGGWEAVLDYGGDQEPLLDGPLGDAPVAEVLAWVLNPQPG